MPLHGRFNRFGAIMEVALAFGLVHVTYRALRYFTVFGGWDAQTNFIPGLTMVTFTVAQLLLCRRSFTTYGLGTERWLYHLNLGLICSLILLAVVGLGLLVTGVHFDASKPPDPHARFQSLRFLGLAIVALPAFLTVLWLVRQKHEIIGRVSPVVSIPTLLGLLVVLPIVAAHFHQPPMWLPTLWLFFSAGFGEELFFRGYIQSRLDQAFGCPFHLPGFDFGPGLLVSALLFGLIHALNTVDYFHGHFDFGWWYGVQNIFTGLFFGFIRANTGSVLPGAIVHGLQDVFARIPSLHH